MTIRYTYTLEETDLIVQIWMEETNDAIRGVDQKGEAYWTWILDRVNPLIGANFKYRQFQGHWARVSADVRLWKSIWTETHTRWPSGHSDDMLRDKAQILFKSRSPNKSAFNYWNAWKILRNNHKFKSMYLEGDMYSSKRMKTTKTGEFTTSASGEEISSSRPIGNKYAKKNELKREELDMKLLSTDTTHMTDAERTLLNYMV
ncbi:uncharacterized protein LOC131003483 [Salvia miltiorrhiza]|uniref:uncharacterized protein LOC131003483 n=1 Tax=Salvia miltiorrhiza TaxID=226208 RepID=UPI0025AB9DC4|nr:uncharacterized protein LOC131003483 [Salvia miltiorrhiza]